MLSYRTSNNTLSRANLNYTTGQVRDIHYGDVLVKYSSVLNVQEERIPYITNSRKVEFEKDKLKNGDIVIADTAEDETAGKVTEIEKVDSDYIVAGLHTIPARPIQKFAPKYLGYYLNSPNYHYNLLPLLQGIKVLSLSKSSILETTVSFPSLYSEQKKIGQLLSMLDNLITLHQRKIEKLKKLKNAYLNEMFV